jgi:hypothetical protein
MMEKLKREEKVMKLFRSSLAVLVVLCGILATHATVSSSTIKVPQDQPTIQAAVQAASPGDTIQVDDGIYKESVEIDKSNLTIKAKNRRLAVLDGEGRRKEGFHTPDKANIDRIVIQGFEVHHFQSSGVQAFDSENKYNSWRVEDNFIHHIKKEGILLGGPKHVIQNNEIAFIGPDGEAMGILLKSSNDSKINNNIIYMIRKNGIRVAHQTFKNKVTNNLIAYTGPGIALNNDNGGNVLMNNYIFTADTGIILKHNECISGFNRIIQNTVVETTDANIVLGENEPPGNCTEVLNNVFARAHKSLIKDTVNRGNKFKVDFNFYDRSVPYILPKGPNGRVRYRDFRSYQQSETGFDANSIAGELSFVNPFLGPQLKPDSPVLNFVTPSVEDGLGRQVGALLQQTLPFRLKQRKMQPVDASVNFSDAKNTTDGRLGSIWQAPGNGPHSITYKLDGTPKYNILWMTPAGHNKPYNIQRFAVDVSEDVESSSFRTIYTTEVDKRGSPHFHEIGSHNEPFIRVRFLNNFPGASEMKVDNIWVVHGLPQTP